MEKQDKSAHTILEELVRPAIQQLEPYTSARHVYKEGLFFDANENSLIDLIPEISNLNRYPDPNYDQLRETIADYVSISPEYIIPTNGSTEALDVIFKTFINAGDVLMTMSPSYQLYKILAGIYNARLLELPLDDKFDLPISAVLEHSYAAKVAIFCSPNNPTGNLFRREHIKECIERLKGIVVVDEAYIECAPEGNSVVDLVHKYPSLIVLRSFSKLWGLAGLRVGYLIANPFIVKYIKRTILPYNISRVAVQLAIKALARSSELKSMREQLCIERDFLQQQLISRGWCVYPSEANFLLARTPGTNDLASYIQKALAEKSIMVRDCSHVHSTYGCIRVTIGKHQENLSLLRELDTLVSPLTKNTPSKSAQE